MAQSESETETRLRHEFGEEREEKIEIEQQDIGSRKNLKEDIIYFFSAFSLKIKKKSKRK